MCLECVSVVYPLHHPTLRGKRSAVFIKQELQFSVYMLYLDRIVLGLDGWSHTAEACC